MKYLKQFLIILGISLIGEILKFLLPLPIPASIYGMVLLFLGLLSGIIKLEAVKDAGKFLIEIMPLMFIPAGVGLMASFDLLSGILLPAIVITVVTLITVMAVTGRVSQFIIRLDRKKAAKKEGKANE
jgi:holin-like protein